MTNVQSAQSESDSDVPGIQGRGYKILEKRYLNEPKTVFEMVIEAPQLAVF